MAKSLLPKSKYSAGAQKAAASFQKQYGANWKKIFYARANKFSNSKGGMHVRANAIYAKGSVIKTPTKILRVR